MSLLTNIGEFSRERVDELAVQIVHLKHLVECLEHEIKNDEQMIRRLEDRIHKLEKNNGKM